MHVQIIEDINSLYKATMTSFFSDELDQNQTGHINSGYYIHLDQWMAQSFKPNMPKQTRVQIKLFIYCNPFLFSILC
jgi:hypothetical protein